MNQKLLIAALVVLLAVLSFQDRIHGTPAEESASFPAAALDLTKVFRKHDGFKQRSAELRAEVQEAEQKLKVHRETYDSKKAELERMEKGTDEYNGLRSRLAALEEMINLDVNRQKATFQRREADNYIDTYDQIAAAVKEYSKDHDI